MTAFVVTIFFVEDNDRELSLCACSRKVTCHHCVDTNSKLCFLSWILNAFSTTVKFAEQIVFECAPPGDLLIPANTHASLTCS